MLTALSLVKKSLNLLISVLKYATQNHKEALIIVLIALVLYCGYINKKKDDQYVALQEKLISLPKEITKKIIIKNGKADIAYREDGKIKNIKKYVPPEGSITIKETIISKDKTKTEVKIKNKGFIFKPGMGILYSKKLYPELDFKWAYLGRYSSTFGITTKFLGIGLTRHLDDLLPFSPQNIEFQVMYGLDFDSGHILSTGIRINF